MSAPDRVSLIDLEQKRCAALAAADATALRAILTRDYTHVHATGRVDTLDVYVDLVTESPRVSERGELAVRQYGDSAIIVGEQINTIDGRKSVVLVTQVAVRDEGLWRFASTHVSRVAEPS